MCGCAYVMLCKLLHLNCLQEIQAKMSRLESVHAQLDAYKDLPAVGQQCTIRSAHYVTVIIHKSPIGLDWVKAVALQAAVKEVFLPVSTAGHWTGPAQARGGQAGAGRLGRGVPVAAACYL